MDVAKRLRWALIAATTIVVFGVFGYMVLGHVGFVDALYMTVITISTVGFGVVMPLTAKIELFMIVLILMGVSTLGFTVATLLEFMIEGHLSGLMERRRMNKELDRLSAHFVVCGFGRVGQEVSRGLAAAGAAFAVIDSDHEQIATCAESGYVCVEGEAQDDAVLRSAGIERARGLIAALDDDADNVFVTLTARQLNPEAFIVARATHEAAESKLKKAGADRVLSPAVIGGRRMASLALKPLVSEYLDIVTRAEQLQFRLEEYEIGDSSCMVGQSLKGAGIRENTGALVLAVSRPQTGFNTNPPADLMLEAGDRLVVMGTEHQLSALERFDSSCRIVPPGTPLAR